MIAPEEFVWAQKPRGDKAIIVPVLVVRFLAHFFSSPSAWNSPQISPKSPRFLELHIGCGIMEWGNDGDEWGDDGDGLNDPIDLRTENYFRRRMIETTTIPRTRQPAAIYFKFLQIGQVLWTSSWQQQSSLKSQWHVIENLLSLICDGRWCVHTPNEE